MVCHYSLYCEKHGLQIRAIGSKYRNEKAMMVCHYSLYWESTDCKSALSGFSFVISLPSISYFKVCKFIDSPALL